MPRMVSSIGQGSLRYPASQAPAFSIIPMSKFDARFAANTIGVGGGTYSVDTALNNQNFDQNPTYTSGDQVFRWLSGNLSMSQCVVDWREGPRIAPTSTTDTFTVDQCFINCVGQPGDHADAFQAIQPATGVATVTITNSCIRSYTDEEAAAIYGAGFIGSDAFFWADGIFGSVTFRNCLFLGGARPIAIFADVGTTTTISFKDIYIAASPNNTPITQYDIRAVPGGTLVVAQWSNVVNATIVGGVIVPGTPIASP